MIFTKILNTLVIIAAIQGISSAGLFTDSQPKSVARKSSDIARSSSRAALGAVACLIAKPRPSVAQTPGWNKMRTTVGSEQAIAVAGDSSTLLLSSKKEQEPKDTENFINGLVSGAATRISKEVLLHPFDTGS